MPPPAPDEGGLGFAWKILSLSNYRDDLDERDGHSYVRVWKGGFRLPISCLNLWSFSFANFEFLCPSATCCTNSFIPFSSCSRCSAYFFISSAVYKTDKAHLCIHTYIPEQQGWGWGSSLHRGCILNPLCQVGSCKLITNLFFCQLSSLLVAFHHVHARGGRFFVAYASLQMSAADLGQLLLEVLLTHVPLPLQVRGQLMPTFH